MRGVLVCLIALVGVVFAGCIGDGDPLPDDDEPEDEPTYVPRVIVGIADTGINPYHEMFYRPDLTEHPSTYLEGFPEDLPALNFSVGGDDWETMFEQDQEVWESIEPDTWYWIPQTVFVAVSCDENANDAYRGDNCILDDGHMHGTGTVSSALMENEHALFAFKDGGPGIGPFIDGGIPVDIYSISWGSGVPAVTPSSRLMDSVYVLAAGNDPHSTLLNNWAGDPRAIVVGGAYSSDDSEEISARKQPDVVSYYCRPTADTMTVTGMRDSYCGTSFATPTVAGALSKVLYAVRNETGHTGGTEGNVLDPEAGLTIGQLRGALNRTASYEPEAQYPNGRDPSLPLNPVAPWMQWGWGFYDGLVADATIAHVLGGEQVPEKPMEAQLWMETVRDVKEFLYG